MQPGHPLGFYGNVGESPHQIAQTVTDATTLLDEVRTTVNR
ncbi:hypothetical protein [Sphaerisporangium album]|nr:hypothetical protein [Sphaerisporangium album]